MNKAIVAAFLFLGSCKSTDSINRFAGSAGSGVTELGRSSFGFGQFCKLYSSGELGLMTDTSLYARSSPPKISCAAYKTSDSLVLIINRTLTDYFSLLQSGSDKKLLSYNARPLVSSLADLQPRLLPDLSFSDEKITAVKGLLNTLLNEPLKYYRAQKLRRIMQENDTALSRVIGAYVFILDSALDGEIDQALENYKSFAYAPLYGKSAGPVEKAFVNNRYKEFQNEMEEERLKIRKSVRVLQTIGKDHHLLASAAHKAGFTEAESEIALDVILINNLIGEIIRLTR
jgi:hypothetical protein